MEGPRDPKVIKPGMVLESLTSILSMILRKMLDLIGLILKKNSCDDFHGNRLLAERPW